MEIKLTEDKSVQAVIGTLSDSIEIVPQDDCIVTTEWSEDFGKIIAVVKQKPVPKCILVECIVECITIDDSDSYIGLLHDVNTVLVDKLIESCGSVEYADRLYNIWHNSNTPQIFVHKAYDAGYSTEQVDMFLHIELS